MKNSNLIIAVVLSFGFLLFWETFVASRYVPTKSTGQPVQAMPPQSPTKASMETPVAIKPITPRAQAGPVILKTAHEQVTINALGARVTSWQVAEKNHWVEVVPQEPSPRLPLETFSGLVFAVQSKSDTSVTFAAQHPEGFIIEKKISLDTSAPFHQVSLSSSNPTKDPVDVQAELGWSGGLQKHIVGNTDKADDATVAEMRVLGLAERVRSWVPGMFFGKHIDEVVAGPFKWVGVDNHHFLAALIPMEGAVASLRVLTGKKTLPCAIIPINMTLAPGETKTSKHLLYVGTKPYSELKALPHDIVKAVDFGYFGVIAKILLRMLEFFHDLTKNYGWAIILLTMTIQILVFPLTKKSLQHSVRMKELQPQVKKLQEQFKQDPKRLQIEMLNLYRKNGMKLMGMEGCFPMLLQIPIFFAFYSTLRVAYELRGASWLWISDLGVHDPIYVLPILMGIGMFVQQKLGAVAADPAQAKMMMFMPVMFTIMFIKLPAGLVLYWTVNSIVTILVQQFLQWRARTHATPSLQ